MLTALRSALLVVSLAQILAWGQQKPDSPQSPDLKNRDLKVRRDNDPVPPAPSAPSVPPVQKGCALIIGVGGYQNLPQGSNLRYSESDAQAIYRVLISPQSGEFSPEN